VLWSWLLAQGMHIQFAHRTFRWSNEASGKAAVHCVIIGFGSNNNVDKTIYEYEDISGKPHSINANNINPYLTDAPNVLISSRSNPICAVTEMQKGNEATDDGHLILSNDEKKNLLSIEPDAIEWIRPFLGGDGFINATKRWCLWLEAIQPNQLRALPQVMLRVNKVKTFRLGSPKEATIQKAKSAWLFGEIRQPKLGSFIVVPKVSSEKRLFVPIGFMEHQTIINNTLQFVPNGSLYEYGVLQSSMHMSWMRATAGRMKSDYQYSISIVYNNYPWPSFNASASETQGTKAQTAIETAAQAVLDARAQFPGSSLADLYDPLTMPPTLVKAHQKLDAAVDAAYAQDTVHAGKKTYATDAERVAYLFALYQRLTSLLPAAAPSKPARKKAALRS
jgi:hypothetical protein